jgi:KaiC/GvpD/RAD55 family RecA-like ATPase
VSEFKDAALTYAAMGYHVIPVEPQGKRPGVPSWREYGSRPATVEEINAWWDATPNANVALVMGRGMIAVDIDGAEGETALAAAGIEIPGDAPSSSTGKGRHVFFKWEGEAPNHVGLMEKVDTRGDMGYVVVAPSVHPSGRRYEWRIPLTMGVSAPPAKLAEVISQGPRKPTLAAQSADTSQNWVIEALAGVGEGKRDVTCTKLAGYLLGKNLPAEAVEALLQDWAARCDPPFSVGEVSKCVASIAARHEPDEPLVVFSMGDALDAALHEIAAGPKNARSTGLKNLDSVLDGGLRAAEYVLIGARPSIGKTAFALQIGQAMALEGDRVLLVSLEMSAAAIARRMLVQKSGVPADAVKTGNLEDFQRVLLEEAGKRLRQLPFRITTSLHSIDHLTEYLSQLSEPEMPQRLIVDYLQLMEGPFETRGNSRGRVEAVSKGLKRIAVRYGISVVTICSLVRPPRDAGRGWKPVLADLRESGELEYDADIVWFLHRDDIGAELTALDVAKNRDGRAGDALNLYYDGPRLTFRESA